MSWEHRKECLLVTDGRILRTLATQLETLTLSLANPFKLQGQIMLGKEHTIGRQKEREVVID